MKKQMILLMLFLTIYLSGCLEYEIIIASEKPFEPTFVFKETTVFDFSVDTYDENEKRRVNIWYIYNKDENNLKVLNKIKFGEVPDGFIQKWKNDLKPNILYSVYLTPSKEHKTYSGKFYIQKTNDGYELLKKTD
jgi:hypothetical protein